MKLVLFDVYGTLLDMGSVEKKVNELLGSKRGYNYWFELFMQYCFVDNCIAKFNNFNAIATATMQMAAHSFNAGMNKEDISDVLGLLKQLPINRDVEKGLSRLNDLGFRIAALTNSPRETVIDRMERTGLISYFEKVLSAEYVGKYKPDIKVYNWAAETLGLPPGEIMMVSIHSWDLAGAANAGMMTGYIKQVNHILYPLVTGTDLICSDLADLVNQISAWQNKTTSPVT
jgi:2-haloacid dehalogenase